MSFKLAYPCKMITIIIMNNLFLVSLLVCPFFFSSCQNNYRQNVPEDSYQSPGIVGVSADAFQVTY